MRINYLVRYYKMKIHYKYSCWCSLEMPTNNIWDIFYSSIPAKNLAKFIIIVISVFEMELSTVVVGNLLIYVIILGCEAICDASLARRIVCLPSIKSGSVSSIVLIIGIGVRKHEGRMGGINLYTLINRV